MHPWPNSDFVRHSVSLAEHPGEGRQQPLPGVSLIGPDLLPVLVRTRLGRVRISTVTSYLIVTSCRTTGPTRGSSSAACETPGGVSRSITFGTVAGSTEHRELVLPGAHTPKL